MNYSSVSELDYQELSRIYPGAKTELRRQPTNGSSFNPGSMVILNIPKMERSFANPATSALRFTLNMSLSAGSAGATSANSSVNLLGNAWSCFSRYVSKMAGGNDFDQIEAPGRLISTITNLTLTPDEKRAMVSMGFNDNFLSGISGTNATLATVGGVMSNLGWGETVAVTSGGSSTRSISFVVPLIGSLNASKMIPLYCAELELNLTVAQIVDALKVVSVANGLSVSAMTISNVEFITEVFTLEESAFNEFLSKYGPIVSLKSVSYSYASGQPIQASGATTIDQVVPFSLNSLKQFIWWTSPSDAFAGNYDGVNVNLSNYQLFIGSQAYPQQPVKCDTVAEIYYQNSKSWGAFYSAGHSGSCNRASMSKASTAGGEFVAYDEANLTSVPFESRLTTANKFYCALDLEQINQLKNNVYSGISTRGNTNILRLNIARATKAVSHNLHMYVSYDVLLTFNMVDGRITYSN